MNREFQDRAISINKDRFQKKTKQTRIAKLLDEAIRFNIYQDPEVKRLLDDFSKMPDIVPDMALDYLEKSITEKRNERKRYPFTNPKAVNLDEEIKIGRELQSRRLVGINPDREMVRHGLVVGESGSTKTSFATSMILNILAYRRNTGKRFGIIIPDIKGDYVGLARIDDEDILVIDPSGLFNPWEIFHPFTNPPKEQLRKIIDNWRTGFVELLCDIYQFGVRGKTILNRAAYNCYEKLGVYQGSNKFPLTAEILEEVESYKVKRYSPMERAKESIISTFQDLILLNLDLSRRHGIPLEEFMGKCLILLLSKYSQEEQQLVIGMFYYWIYKYHFFLGKRNEGLKNLFVIDEAQLVLPANPSNITDQPAIARYLALAREFGIGNFFLSQGKIHTSALQNIDCYFLFRSTSSDIIEDISRRSLMLDTDQLYYQARGLNLGEFICVIKGRINEPIVVAFPEPSIDKCISDEEIEEIMQKKLKNLDYIYEEDSESKNEKKKSEFKIFQNIKDFMKVLAKDQFMPVTKVYKLADLSLGKGDKIKKVIISKGYVNEHKINLGTQGSLSNFLEITQIGYKFLDDNGIFYEVPKGKGSFLHKFWQAVICKYYLNSGYKVSIEGLDYGVDNRDYWKLMDLIAERNGERLIIEVELNSQNVINNIKRDMNLTQDFNSLLIATHKHLMPKVKKLIEDNFNEDINNKISIRLLYEFL